MKEWAKQTPRVARGIEHSDFTEAQFELMREMHGGRSQKVTHYLMKALSDHPNSRGIEAGELQLRGNYLAHFYCAAFAQAISHVFDTQDLLTQAQMMQRFTQSQTRLDALLHQHYEALVQQNPAVANLQNKSDFLAVGHDFYQRVFAYMKTAVMLQQAVSADKGRMH